MSTSRIHAHKWYHIEHIRKKDLLLIGLFKKYVHFFEQKRLDKSLEELTSKINEAKLEKGDLGKLLVSQIFNKKESLLSAL